VVLTRFPLYVSGAAASNDAFVLAEKRLLSIDTENRPLTSQFHRVFRCSPCVTLSTRLACVAGRVSDRSRQRFHCACDPDHDRNWYGMR
jgi:hypothetical protein